MIFCPDVFGINADWTFLMQQDFLGLYLLPIAKYYYLTIRQDDLAKRKIELYEAYQDLFVYSDFSNSVRGNIDEDNFKQHIRNELFKKIEEERDSGIDKP